MSIVKPVADVVVMGADDVIPYCMLQFVLLCAAALYGSDEEALSKAFAISPFQRTS